jgi:hypothetical protein
VNGWEESPRWQAPPAESFARPLIVASLFFGASAAVLSLRVFARSEDLNDGAPVGGFAVE